MSRQEAVTHLAKILEIHHSDPGFGCSCIRKLAEAYPRLQFELEVPWEVHIANIAFDAAKGF